MFPSFLGGSVNPEALELVFIEGDTEAGAFGYLGAVRIEDQRLTQQVGLMVVGAEDVGRIRFAVEIYEGCPWSKCGTATRR